MKRKFRSWYFGRAILATAAAVLGLTVQAQEPGAQAASSAFNPAMSLIMDATFASFDQKPATYAIPGVALADETGPGEEGFSLGESELVVSSNVDDKFYALLTAALTPENEVEVEEAFIETTALGYGATIKAGRFFSGIGYLNEQHTHVWDFVDTALPYRAILGNQYGDDGVQLRWVAPTDLFIEVGAEMFRGDGYPAGGAANDGKGTKSIFLHVGDDVGASHSWRAGISRLNTRAINRETGTTPDLFTGDSNVTIVDFLWKWAPNRSPSEHYLKLQAEYLRRDEDGAFNTVAYDTGQHGWYVQGVYQFMPRWRVGVRHDTVEADNVPVALAGTVLDNQQHKPERTSLMVDFSNSEFSRLRLQYNNDDSRTVSDTQWYVQYLMSLGAHGAHKY
ncbi:MAG: hypothetical protein FD165_2582 [Gammaproteobacteria bacterium]|nr:MAG: hypothetical protein FD165_2582 [Gammaproteobacteria bacterium]TND04057.1 MAG: hypothetical protein FD120_1766 [Gammaproteobacteria bacterium]